MTSIHGITLSGQLQTASSRLSFQSASTVSIGSNSPLPTSERNTTKIVRSISSTPSVQNFTTPADDDAAHLAFICTGQARDIEGRAAGFFDYNGDTRGPEPLADMTSSSDRIDEAGLTGSDARSNVLVGGNELIFPVRLGRSVYFKIGQSGGGKKMNPEKS